MSAIDTILGFPRRFNSSQDKTDQPDNVIFLLRRLWTNIKCSIGYDVHDEIESKVSTVLDGQEIILPRYFPNGSCENNLVQYLQDLLDLNGYEDLIILLDHNEERDFEILTQVEFMAKLKYPISEYRADTIGCDGTPIQHPNIPYTLIWVAKKTGRIFRAGDASDFSHDSVCWKSCFGDVRVRYGDIQLGEVEFDGIHI